MLIHVYSAWQGLVGIIKDILFILYWPILSIISQLNFSALNVKEKKNDDI